MRHSLQIEFAAEAGENAWCAHLRDLFESGRLDEAEALLTAAVAELDGDVGALCRQASRAAVQLTGWPELI